MFGGMSRWGNWERQGSSDSKSRGHSFKATKISYSKLCLMKNSRTSFFTLILLMNDFILSTIY